MGKDWGKTSARMLMYGFKYMCICMLCVCETGCVCVRARVCVTREKQGCVPTYNRYWLPGKAQSTPDADIFTAAAR